jgi:hypothetical protein
MPNHLYDGWYDGEAKDISPGRKLHLFTERKGARNKIEQTLIEAVKTHYEDPAQLAQRMIYKRQQPTAIGKRRASRT